MLVGFELARFSDLTFKYHNSSLARELQILLEKTNCMGQPIVKMGDFPNF